MLDDSLSALQVSLTRVKCLLQLHLKEPLVLLQMWEQIPNWLHSFLSAVQDRREGTSD